MYMKKNSPLTPYIAHGIIKMTEAGIITESQIGVTFNQRPFST